nr:hypothetical protein [Tanacetum cinerariifolium]
MPFVQTRYEGVDIMGFSPLFYAYKAQNITIKGRGIIDGQGKRWWDFAEGESRRKEDSKWQQEFRRQNTEALELLKP